MLLSGRVNFTFARGEVLDHSTAGPTGSPMHRTRCLRFRSRRPVNPKPQGRDTWNQSGKRCLNFCWWCENIPGHLWVCPLFWGFNFNPEKKRRPLKLQSKQGVNWVGFQVCISSKTSRFWTTPESCLFLFDAFERSYNQVIKIEVCTWTKIQVTIIPMYGIFTIYLSLFTIKITQT